MADFEFEDREGNKFRLQRGAGPALHHADNHCSGSSYAAESLLNHVNTDVIYKAHDFFYFDILSKIPNLPSVPLKALAAALCSSYLILHKVNTARAIEEEVVDNRPYLRVQIRAALSGIVQQEQRNSDQIQAGLDQKSTTGKIAAYAEAVGTGVGTAAWGLASWLKEASDLVNPVVRIRNHIEAAQQARGSANFAEAYKKNALKAEKRELVEVLGFDPTALNEGQLDDALEMVRLVMNDNELFGLFKTFAKDYANAQHAIEISEMAGGGIFELVLTIVLAAVTGGVGVIAVLGSKAYLIRRFAKVGELLKEFADLSRKIARHKARSHSKGSGPGKLESVNATVKKTDAHGAETGAVTRKSPENVWHTSDAAPKIQGVLNGIDPKYLNPESRFGAAFYVGEQPGTTVAELAHHKVDANYSIRFKLNNNKMQVLDLTDPEIAKEWGYNGGPISSKTQAIGTKAKESGFNVIRFPSERATGGINNAVLSDFNEILEPIGVSPVK